MRILHFSDVHVEAPLSGVPLGELASKKLVGLTLLRLWRGRRFRGSAAKLDALARFMRAERVDVVVCTGDHTALGTEPELATARRALSPFESAPHGLVTLPGNHDIYLPGAVRDRRFERHFAELLESDLPEHCADGPWPLVRLVGDHLAVVAVNSARPNPQVWRSSGRISAAQLAALERVLADRRLGGRFVIVATHYAPRLANGRPDNFRHGLVDAERFLAVCRRIERGAVLHGHVHDCFHVRVPGMRAPLLGAGSCTDAGKEGLWLLELDGTDARATPGRFDGADFALRREASLRL